MANRRRRSARPQVEIASPQASSPAPRRRGGERREPRHQPPLLQELAGQAAAVVLVLGSGGAALALPQGMVVTGGQLQLSHPRAGEALILQGSNRAAADFRSFNIESGERVQIRQPSSSSALLGRVTGGDITEIHGRLDANGRVLLVNPAGVLVGPSGTINTAAFTATTLQVDPARFMAGGPVELKALPGGDPGAAVIHQGRITVADDGFAALIAPQVVNQGVITAKLGQVQLASGTQATLDISGDGLLSVALDPAVAGSITSSGTIQASHVRIGGGDAAALAAATVDLGGVVEARNGAQALGLPSIAVQSAGAVRLSGRLDASGQQAGSSGGAITVSGSRIRVGGEARLDASGPAGGGSVLVGGSWQNSDPALSQATTTRIAQGAVLDASASRSGDGGTIVVWSDIHNPAGSTTVAGSLRATGGSEGGNGGRIETSGALLNTAGIQINASASKGLAGLWLLDPTNVTISANASTGGSLAGALGQAGVSNIATTDIQSAINAGTSVNVVASGSITQQAPLSFNVSTAGATPTLTLDNTSGSKQAITLAAITDSTTASGSGVNVTALSAGGAITSGGAISLKGGFNLDNTYAVGGNASGFITYSNATTLATGPVAVNASVTAASATLKGTGSNANGVTVNSGGSVTATAGPIDITGISNSPSSSGAAIYGQLRTTGSGDVTVRGISTAANGVLIGLANVISDNGSIGLYGSTLTSGTALASTHALYLSNTTQILSAKQDLVLAGYSGSNSQFGVYTGGPHLAGGNITFAGTGAGGVWMGNPGVYYAAGNLNIIGTKLANNFAVVDPTIPATATVTHGAAVTTGTAISTVTIGPNTGSFAGLDIRGAATVSGRNVAGNAYGVWVGQGNADFKAASWNITASNGGSAALPAFLANAGTLMSTSGGVTINASTTSTGVISGGAEGVAQITIPIVSANGVSITATGTNQINVLRSVGSITNAAGDISLIGKNTAAGSAWGINMSGAITQNANGGNVSFVSNNQIYQTGPVSVVANTSGTASSVSYDTTTGNKDSAITSGALTVAGGSTSGINFIEKTAGAAITAAAINVPGYILLDNTWGAASGAPSSGYITSSNFATLATTTASGVTFTGGLTAGTGITLKGASYSGNHGVYSAGQNLTTAQGDIVVNGISNTGSGYWNQYAGVLTATTGNINLTGYIGAGNTAVNLNTTLVSAPQGTITANGTVNGNGAFAFWSSGAISSGRGITVTGVTNSTIGYNAVDFNATSLTVTGTGSSINVTATRSTPGGGPGINTSGTISGASGSNISFVSNNRITQTGAITLAANTSGTASSVTYDTTTGTKDSSITAGPLTVTSGSTSGINFIEKTAGASITSPAINVPGYILLDNTWGAASVAPSSGYITAANAATLATASNGITLGGALTAGSYAAGTGVTLKGVSTTGVAVNQQANAITSNAGGITIQGAGSTATTVISGSGTFTNAAGDINVSSTNSTPGGNWTINLTGAINQNANGGSIRFSSNQAIYQVGAVTLAANTSGTPSSVTYNTTTGNRLSQIYVGNLTLTGGLAASTIDIDYSVLASGAPITVGAIAMPGSITLDNSYLNGVAAGITLANADTYATNSSAGLTAGALTAGRNVNLYGVTSVNNTGLYAVTNNGNVLTSQRVSGGALNITAFASSPTGAGLQGSATNVIFQSGTSAIAGGDITLLGNNNNINSTGYWLRNGGNNIIAYGSNVNWGTAVNPVVSGWPNRTTGNITATAVGGVGGNINIYGTTTSAGSFPAFSSSGSLTADGSITILGVKTIAYDAPVVDVTGPITLTGVIPQSNLSVRATQPSGGGNSGMSLTGAITQNSNGGNISFVSNGRISQTGTIAVAANTSGTASSVTYDTTTGTKASTITSGALTVASGSTSAINFIEKTAGAAITAAAVNLPGYILLDNTWGAASGAPASGYITAANAASLATASNGITLSGALTAGSYAATTGVTLKGVSTTGIAVNQQGNAITSNAGGITIQGAGTTATTVISGSGTFTNASGDITVAGNNTAAGGSTGINLAGAINQNASGGNISFVSNNSINQTGAVTVAANATAFSSSVTYDTTTGDKRSNISAGALTVTGGMITSASGVDYTMKSSGSTIYTPGISVPGSITLDNTYLGGVSGGITLSNASTYATSSNYGVGIWGTLAAGAAISIKGVNTGGAYWGGQSAIQTSGNISLLSSQKLSGHQLTIDGLTTASNGQPINSVNTTTFQSGSASIVGGDINVFAYNSGTNSAIYGGQMPMTAYGANINIGTQARRIYGGSAINGGLGGLVATRVNGVGGNISMYAAGTTYNAIANNSSATADGNIIIDGSMTIPSTGYVIVSLGGPMILTNVSNNSVLSVTSNTVTTSGYTGANTGISSTGAITVNSNGGSVSFISNNSISQTGVITVAPNTSNVVSGVTYDTTSGTKASTITSGALTVGSGSNTAINYTQKTAGAAISAAAVNLPGYILLDNTWGAASGAPASGYITAANAASLATASAGVSVNGALTAGAYAGSTGITLKGISAAGYGVYSASNLTSGTGAYLSGTTSGTGSNAVYLNNVALSAAGTFTAGQDAIAISGTNGTTAAVNLLGNTAITNNSSRGRINIIANNGNFLDPVTVTSSSSAGAISVAAIGNTAAIVSAAGTTFTQNSNDGVFLSTSNAGNLQPPKIINNGSGNVYLAAGATLPVGTGSGGQIVGVTGNSISQAGGGITYLYSGNPSSTTGLGLLSPPLATQSQANVRFGQAAGTGNTALAAIPVIDGALYNTANLSTASPSNPVVRYRIDPNFNLRLSASEFSKVYGTADATALSTYFNAALITSGYSSTRSTTSAVTAYNATTGNFTFSYGPVVMTYSKAQLVAALLNDNTGNRAGYGTVTGQQVNTTTGYSYSSLKADSFVGGTLNAVNGADSPFTLVEKITPKPLTISNGTLTQLYDNTVTYNAVVSAAGTTPTALVNTTVDGVTLTDTLTTVSQVLRSGATVGAGSTLDGTTIAQAGPFNATPAAAVITGTGGIASTGNYAITYVGAVNTITPITVSVSVTGATTSVPYNGAVQTNAQPTAVGVQPGDSISFTGLAAGTDAGVYNDNLVAVAGSGTNLANYVFSYTNGTLTITPLAATVTGNVSSKPYNGQPQTSGYTFSGVLPGDTSAITVNGAAFATKVAEGIVADQFTGVSGAKAGNYTFSYVPGSIQITPRLITPSGVTALAKIYDGTTRADLNTSALSLPGIIPGDQLTITPSGTFSDKNAASSKNVTISYAGSGADAANYVFANTASSATIFVKYLIPTGITANNKQYDGTTSATVTIGTIGLRSAVAAALSSGTDGSPIAGDAVSYNSSDIWTLSTATFADKNAGSGKSVNVQMILQTSGPRLLGADASNYGLIINNFNTTADITPKPLTVSGITAADKTYDGTTAATISTAGVTSSSLQGAGMIAGDDLSILAATGQFNSKDVLRDANTPSTILAQAVAVSAIPGGADLQNYTISYSPVTAKITPATLTLTAHDDGKIVTQSDATDFNGASLSGFVPGDDATSAGVGTISVSRTGTGSVESAGSYSGVLVPSASGQPNNYSITTANGDFTIVPAGQLLVKANNEATVYGDSYNYSIASAAYLPTGGGAAIFSFNISDPAQVSTSNGVVTLNDGAGGTASFTFGTQGSNLLSGANQLKAGLYDIGAAGTPTINNPNLNSSTIVFVGSHQVSPKPISVSGITAADKVYDGSPSATVSTTNALFNGRLAGDALALSATGQFTNKNAGLRTVALSSSYSGADLANYQITDQASTTATITPKPLSVSGLLRADKVYDGTTSASVSGTAVLAGAIAVGTGSSSDGLPYDGDGVSVDQSAAVASFNDKNVLLATGLSYSGLVLSGAESGNYTLLPHPTVAASITPLTLTPSAQPLPQTYNGTTAAQLSLGLFGALPGDSVALNGTSTLASPRAGVQTATTTGLSLSGPDAGNYALPAGVNSLTTPNVTVSPAALSISGDISSLVYNGQLQTNTYQVVGLMPADSLNLTVSGMAQARNVSDGIVPDSLQYTLVNPGDYTVTLNNGSLQITPLTISASATLNPKTYDGTTNASATLRLNGVLPADAASLGVSGTTSLSGANAGNQTATVSGLTLSGNDLGNYALASDSFNAGSIAVARAALTVTGDVSSLPYNGLLQTNTFTVTGLVNGDTLTVKRSAQARNVSDGTVADNLLVQLPTPGNYTVTINNGSLRITPLTISAAATLNPKTYDGTTNASSALSLNGVLPGDLAKLGVIGTTTLSGANAGPQTATVSGLTLTGNELGNYALSADTLDAGSLEVAKAPLLILPKADAKLLGQRDPAFSYSVQGLQGGDALGSVSITRPAGETPGTYGLSASAATAAPGTDLSNYAITYSPAGSFSILGAEKLLIRQPNGQAIYGTAAAAAISSVQYLAADGSTILSLSNTPGTNIWSDGQGGSITITPTIFGASIRSNAGLYAGALTNTNSGITNANGNFNQVVTVAGDLLITPAPLTIRGDISSRIYNGQVQTNTYRVVGLVNGDSLSVSGSAQARNVSEGMVLDQLQASLATPGNYTVTILNGSLQITPAPLVILPKADAKLLGQGDPAFSYTAQGLQGRDALGSVAITRPSGETPGTYSLSATAATAAAGTDLSNYSISYSPGGSFTIVGPERLLIRQPNAQVVYGTAASAAISSVEYLGADGTTIFRLSNTPGTNIWSDGHGGSITITPTLLGASARSNAGLYTGALNNTNSGITNANGNFNAVVIAAGDLLITPAALTIRGANSSRVYNGQVQTNTYRVVGLVNGDSVSVSGSAQARNVSEGIVLDQLQASLATPGNYTVTIQNGSLQITPYLLDLSGASTRGPRLTANADKTYDGTTSAGRLTLSGLFGSDAVSITGGTGMFLDANAGEGKTVIYGGFSLSGADAANYALPAGLPTFTTTADIARATLTISGVSTSQVYNGTTQSNGSATIVGLLPGDALTISGYGAGRNVGTYADNLVASAGANTSLSNYDISYVNGAITITPYLLDLSGSSSSGPRIVASASKTYDGTRQAGGGLTISGLLGGDAVSITGGTGMFLDANAGEGKTVIYGGFSLSGADAANYALPAGLPTFTTTADIARAAVTISGVSTSQVYNGTTQSNGSATIVGLLPGDALTISGYGAGRNVGTYADNLVATAGANTSLSNYDISYVNGAITITPYLLDLSGSSSSGPRIVASASKTYDGTRQAGGGLTISGLLGGDAVSITGGTGMFLDANAGEGKTVIYGGFSLSGADAANYALPAGLPIFTTTADIARAAVTISGVSTSQVYNGATQSNGSATIVGLLPGDALTISGYGAGRNVGTYADNLVATAGANTSLSNYDISYVNGAITITPYLLDLSGSSSSGPRIVASASKTYDGTRQAGGGLTISGLLGGDAVSITGGTGMFLDANAGEGKTVIYGGFSLSGADAANYALPAGLPTFTTTADIARATLTITGASTTKTFNGAIQSNGSVTIVGLMPGEQIKVSGYASGRDVGVYRDALTVKAQSGTSLANYALLLSNGVLTISQPSQPLSPLQPPSLPLKVTEILPFFAAFNPGVVQNQQSATSAISGTPSIAGAPIGPSGLPAPYPIAMASDADGRSAQVGGATPLGPLHPLFLVQHDRSERFVMGQGSVQIDPGQDVCLNRSGCAPRAAASTSSPDLDITGVEPGTRFPETSSLLEPQERWSGRPHRPSRTAPSPSAMRRWTHWLFSSR